MDLIEASLLFLHNRIELSQIVTLIPRRMWNMLIHELLSRSPTPSLASDLLMVPFAVVIALNDPSYETLWDAANRICDQYLPKLKQP